jgi:polysaccharide export outer membrane protein
MKRESHLKISIRRLIAVALSVLFVAACAPAARNSTPLQHQAAQLNPKTEQEYRIQVGDQLDIKFFYNPELNEQVTVRPDGRISLQLVHEVMVAGLTPAELNQLLSQKYAPELKKPEIAVIVRSFGAQRAYVDGEVTRPGMITLIGTVTVLQAISQAGGMKETARTSEVLIIRRSEFNKPIAFQVNLRKAIESGDTSHDIALQPSDIIYVPRSAIANVNVWVDQYIRRILPVSLSTGFGYYP